MNLKCLYCDTAFNDFDYHECPVCAKESRVLKTIHDNLKINDPVNNPLHYKPDSVYETIKVIEAWGLDKDYYLGNAIKYISRAGKKDPAKFNEDIEKAIWYLNRRLERQL